MTITALISIAIFAGAGVFLLTRLIRNLSLKTQVLVLAALAVCIDFLFLVLVQLPKFSMPLGVLLVAIVFSTSCFGVPLLLRGLNREENSDTVPGPDPHPPHSA